MAGGRLGKAGWILGAALLASVLGAQAAPTARAVPAARAGSPATSQTRAAHWLGLVPGARWSWSFAGRGSSGPAGKTQSCAFRASVEDRVLTASRRGDLLQVEVERRVDGGTGDRCDGLLPVPRSGRVVLLIGSQ